MLETIALYKSKFVEILFDEKNSVIVDKFLSSTYRMLEHQFKDEMHVFVEMCQKYQPQRELVHLLDMKFIITPEVQDWMNQKIFPTYEKMIKRMAFLMPTEYITSLSVDQTMQEEVGRKFLQSYFDDETKAVHWLLQPIIV